MPVHRRPARQETRLVAVGHRILIAIWQIDQ
jgi:hypothetical protein